MTLHPNPMTSFINPVIHAALDDVLSAVERDRTGAGEALAARLGRIARQIVLFRCSASLRLFDLYLPLITRARPGLDAAIPKGERDRVLLGWPAGTLRGRLDFVEAECREPASLALFRESLDEVEALLGPLPVARAEPAAVPTSIGPIVATGQPGVSLVTCAMNRSENLLRALPGWLSHAEVAEVLIVDWSSDQPVAETLLAAGIRDSRIRVVRVEGEKRWILSYAFNLGFRLARLDRILKVDADVTLSEGFFRDNPLGPDSFIAGNWRTASPDQPHVNGFFYLPRAALAEVAGFNEHITTYGWDDEELYARLALAGYRRTNVASGSIHHLPHSDAARTGAAQRVFPAPQQPASETLVKDVQFLIRRNRLLAVMMPDWDARAELVPFEVVDAGPLGLTVRRGAALPSAVPETVREMADLHTARELLSWRLGRAVLGLTGPAMAAVLARPEADIGAVDVALAALDPERVARGPGRYLVIDLPRDLPVSASAALPKLADRARGLGLHPVLRAPGAVPDLPPGVFGVPATDLPLPEAQATTDELMTGEIRRGRDLSLDLAGADLDRLASLAPVVIRPRGRLYIDAQHGLGNRLRAIASAAVIAEAEGSELVIIWQPDDHCDCRFGDLFDYAGPVIEERFLDEARARGWQVLNYMSAEAGADKDAPVELGRGRDIYARSAYVLKAPVSTWEAESAILRALRPTRAVLDLVGSVRHPNDLSVHVRMQGGAAHEHLPYERPGNWLPEDHAAIAHWRALSHHDHFLRRIDRLIAEGGVETLFLAADLPETYDLFQDRYGERLACLRRSRYDRSAEQLQYGLADALLLGEAPRMLGSTWSSFSELAQRLAPKEQVVEMSGTDF